MTCARNRRAQYGPWPIATGVAVPGDGEQSAPVGSFPPNRFGLHDTSGNVYEWTCSLWREQFDGSEEGCADGDDPARRVLRGGAWFSDQGSARSAFRDWSNPDYRYDFIGFRVLCSSPILDP